MAYNQYQLALLQYYATNPQALGWLRQSFQTAQAPDQAAIDAQAKAKQNEYLSGQVAPQLARLMVQDGPTASSFAAARQAALAQTGQSQADNVYADAKANAQDAAYRQYAMQKQYDDDNWSTLSGGLYANGGYGGGGQDQGMRLGGVGSSTTRAPGMNGGFADKALEYGVGAANYAGKKAYTDMQAGTNPFARYGTALGQMGGAIAGAPKAIGSAIRNGWNSM
ncbi:MAG: hypothetical protein IPP97_27445 [Candidatus Obscuribacter sp.]|nr:hypothetical protein [Candidatus Obscuribacter sp.]MBP6350018.1 hypothetical protein [Candidatus Obscuribacter sp.]